MPQRSHRTIQRRRLGSFAAGLWSEWHRLKLPVDQEQILIAVSGGADSAALLLAMHELTTSHKLASTLIVAHLDHGLRKQALGDAKVVAALAEKLGLKIVIGRADVRQKALDARDNLEQAARKARYAFLERTAKRLKLKHILLAHTMNDQAETVLLRLMRGSGGEGLGGMQAVRPVSTGSPILLVRPLLSWAHRSDTEAYCKQRAFAFIEDEMNQDETFARVKVRRQLLPLMQSFNNRIVETLFRTATVLREDNTTLADKALELLSQATEKDAKKDKTNHPVLNVNVLARAPVALRRRALRQWLLTGLGDLRRVEHVHLMGVERLLEGEKGGRVAELPNGARIMRKSGRLELIRKKS